MRCPIHRVLCDKWDRELNPCIHINLPIFTVSLNCFFYLSKFTLRQKVLAIPSSKQSLQEGSA